ncbi:MAG: transposase [Burkholderiales bacterium]|nr:transposase [Burkholderiales bacterium]
MNKSVHIVLGVNQAGEKEVLGLWLAENERASSGCRCWQS